MSREEKDRGKASLSTRAHAIANAVRTGSVLVRNNERGHVAAYEITCSFRDADAEFFSFHPDEDANDGM